MTFPKGTSSRSLKIPLVEIWEVHFQAGQHHFNLPLLPAHDLFKMLRSDAKLGIPQCAAFSKSDMSLSLFPRPDRRYRVRVIGTQIVEQ